MSSRFKTKPLKIKTRYPFKEQNINSQKIRLLMFALAPTIYRRFCFCFHLFFQLLLFLPYSLCSKWKSKGSFQYVNRLMSDFCSIPQMAPYFFQNKCRVFTVVYKALLDLAHLSSVIFHLSP